MLLKAETHYFVFLYQCLQHSGVLGMLHCALMINMPSSAYLELIVTQNLLFVEWILQILGKAGQAWRRQQIQQQEGGSMPNQMPHTCSPLLFT